MTNIPPLMRGSHYTCNEVQMCYRCILRKKEPTSLHVQPMSITKIGVTGHRRRDCRKLQGLTSEWKSCSIQRCPSDVWWSLIHCWGIAGTPIRHRLDICGKWLEKQASDVGLTSCNHQQISDQNGTGFWWCMGDVFNIDGHILRWLTMFGPYLVKTPSGICWCWKFHGIS